MRYKVCDKCGEVVAKTGFITSNTNNGMTSGHYAQCNDKECKKYFSEAEHKKLKEIDFG